MLGLRKSDKIMAIILNYKDKINKRKSNIQGTNIIFKILKLHGKKCIVRQLIYLVLSKLIFEKLKDKHILYK